MKDCVVKSLPLRNGIYTFSVLCVSATYSSGDGYGGIMLTSYSCVPLLVAITSQGDKYLNCYPLINDSLITMYVHDEYLFLKLIEGDKVKSTMSVVKTDLFSISIYSLLPYNCSYSCSFHIYNHVQ